MISPSPSIHSQTPKISLSSAVFSSMFLFLTWYFHDCCGLFLLLLQCGVHRWIFFGVRLSSILRKFPYHFICLIWILSKIDCSACILLLTVVFEIFCNLDTRKYYLVFLFNLYKSVNKKWCERQTDKERGEVTRYM